VGTVGYVRDQSLDPLAISTDAKFPINQKNTYLMVTRLLVMYY